MALTKEQAQTLKIGSKLWFCEGTTTQIQKFPTELVKKETGRLILNVDRGTRPHDREVWSIARNRPMRDGGSLTGSGTWLELRCD